MSEDQLHPCARCARVQRTCCQRAEIVLTTGDTDRIAAHSGRRDFLERRAPADPDALAEDPADPNWTRWTIAPDGTRRVLRRRADGDCTFLGPAGCTLPLEVRPLVCRMYPYTFTERGLDREDPAYCPTDLVDPLRTGMLTVLDMREADAERWRRLLYAELRSDAEEGTERT